jgi:uncharacterized protein
VRAILLHISIEFLKKEPGVEHSFSFEEEAAHLDLQEDGVEFRKPLDVRLTAKYSNGKVFLNGSLRTEVVQACSRCLQSFSCLLKSFFQEEVEVEDQLVLSMADLVREAVIFEIPLKPLCHEFCKGLCFTCGNNLNEKQCDCRLEQVDHRMSLLKKMLEQE